MYLNRGFSVDCLSECQKASEYAERAIGGQVPEHKSSTVYEMSLIASYKRLFTT